MRRYDYTLGRFIEDDSKEPFSAYSIVDGGLISYNPQESIKYDEDNEDMLHP